MLALLGVYGVLSYSVSLRAQEMGIRLALGSGQGKPTAADDASGDLPLMKGALVGLSAATVAVHWVQSLLHETKLVDPPAIGSSILLLLLTGALEGIRTARRAARVEPMQILRTEESEYR
jgi:putative ABC transport system permease protein